MSIRPMFYLTLMLVLSACVDKSEVALTWNSDYINPFMGVNIGEGNTFPGVSLPFGMVKPGPNYEGRNTNSGYNSTIDKIAGFSHVHVSGTGGGPKYGNISFLPYFDDNYDKDSCLYRSKEYAEAGYYRVSLSQTNHVKQRNRLDAIQVELTATQKAGFHRYLFSKSEKVKLVVDVGSFLYRNRRLEVKYNEEQGFVGGNIEVLSDTTIRGYSEVEGGWNQGEPYIVYFYAVFDRPFTGYEIKNNITIPVKSDKGFDNFDSTLCILEFEAEKQQELKVKVGISFLNASKAKENLYSENTGINHWNFESIVRKAKNEWEEILGKIEIDTDDKIVKENFYTGIYRAYIMPVDRTGEFSGIKDNMLYYDDYYTIWDTYRTVDPLRTLITPEYQKEVLISLLNIYKSEGFFPDGRSGNSTGRTQGGTNVDILFADALYKGVLPDSLYPDILEALIENSSKKVHGELSRKKGRGGVQLYKQYGYMPYNSNSFEMERAGSRTLEYAYCDWAIKNIADSLYSMALNKKDTIRVNKYRNIIEEYTVSSANWKNLWDADYELEGIKGFIRPKDSFGNWINKPGIFQFDKTHTWSDFFYEGTSWVYSLFVPHDGKSLIELSGGDKEFIKRLDYLFDNNKFDITNEPSFLIPVAYNQTSEYWKTAERVNQIKRKYFYPTIDGLPGNDDSGALSSWYVFHALGFYPLAGSDIYHISTPSVNGATIKSKNGEFKLTVENLSADNIYIQEVVLNGKQLNRLWLKHEELSAGNELRIKMGADKRTFKIR